ncbi:MAG TPA: DUF6295 family protein [Jatrophihabitantaceae bacterium]|jgi:hypothetical protein|nr:DUF6295 family protein [Jatrophihabitantaceae bacterium]
MCTYATMHADIDGSAKGPGGTWQHVTDATVYFDHPVHALHEHTLNIDLADPSRGPSNRIALELSATSARQLVAAINDALAAVPTALREDASA